MNTEQRLSKIRSQIYELQQWILDNSSQQITRTNFGDKSKEILKRDFLTFTGNVTTGTVFDCSLEVIWKNERYWISAKDNT